MSFLPRGARSTFLEEEMSLSIAIEGELSAGHQFESQPAQQEFNALPAEEMFDSSYTR